MTSMDDLSAFAISRGEGLHPKLRELFERTLAVPFSEVTVRPDGMLQAGPNPGSEKVEPHDVATSAPRDDVGSAEMKKRLGVIAR